MTRDAKNDWGNTPNGLLPESVIHGRYHNLRSQRSSNYIAIMNHKRKIAGLIKKVDDSNRFLRAIEQDNVPVLWRLLLVHHRNGGGLLSCIEKMKRANDLKRVGDNALVRCFNQRGKLKDGKLDPAAFCVLNLTLIMVKLGCH